jgi:membrane carboxypeptidase/penicillin-binding protein
MTERVPAAQLKSILQGVLSNGTGRAFRHLAPYAAGKTGTTDDELDAWFVGFTNDVTVAIWVGYDNADRKRRTLGRGQTGGRVALPMFEPVLDAVWENYAPKTPLKAPSDEAMEDLVALENGGQTEFIRRGYEGMRSVLVAVPEQLGAETDRAAGRQLNPSASQFRVDHNRTFGDWLPRQAPTRFRSFREDFPMAPRRIDPDYPFGARLN